MTRAARTAVATLVTFAILAPQAFAQASGEGLYGEVDDKVITKAGFILIGAFPAFIFLMSLLQWSLDRRKDARKAALKRRESNEIWRGGW